jgi:hypothetical protein
MSTAKSSRKPGKRLRQLLRGKRLLRLMRYQWALRKMWGLNKVWRRLELKPWLDKLLP